MYPELIYRVHRKRDIIFLLIIFCRKKYSIVLSGSSQGIKSKRKNEKERGGRRGRERNTLKAIVNVEVSAQASVTTPMEKLDWETHREILQRAGNNPLLFLFHEEPKVFKNNP